MRKYLVIVFALCLVKSITGQELNNLGKAFVMRGNYAAKQCDATGGNLTSTEDALLRTYKIIVESITSTGYVISVPDFVDSTLNEKYVRVTTYSMTVMEDGSYKSSKQPAREIYFFIPFTDFNKYCEASISPNSFTVGLPTIPIKLRFGNGGKGEDPRYFRFEGNVSLGLSGGWKHTFGASKQYAFNILLGFTIASVTVDSTTTKGRVKSNTSAASFSPHLGFVFDFQQFQVGLYSGVDYLYGEPNRYWVYRNQPWLGIGIGYSLFKVGTQANSNH